MFKSVAATTEPAVPAVMVMSSVPEVLIPTDFNAVAIAATVPEIAVTWVASTTVDVLASIVFKSVAAADPGSIVTPTFAALLMPVAVRAFAISTAVPVSRVTEVATIVLVVIASSKFKSFALIDKSVTVADAKDAGAPVV